jgi:hypothetical protein
MILYDHWGHMVSTISIEDLHEFARIMGLDRRLYHGNGHEEYHAHYDLLNDRLKERARAFNAVKVRARELVERAWWSRTARRAAVV